MNKTIYIVSILFCRVKYSIILSIGIEKCGDSQITFLETERGLWTLCKTLNNFSVTRCSRG